MFWFVLTKVFLAVEYLSASESPEGPKMSSHREKMSLWVNVRGRSVRYAKPVVEKMSSSCLERDMRASGLGFGFERTERDTNGREENDVVILRSIHKRQIDT